MKPFDNFIKENGKGASLQWGATHVFLARRVNQGGKSIVRTTSLAIPPEWRNAGGPPLAAWQKPWIKGPSKPKARTKHLAPTVWNGQEVVHPSGAIIVRKREHGGTRESFTVRFPGIEAAESYCVFIVRQIFAHLMQTLPRPIARQLANPAEKRAILENAAMIHRGSLAASVSAWIKEKQGELAADKRERRQAQKAKKARK